MGARDESSTQRGTARPKGDPYNNPEERKRVTGSVTGTGCRLKIQRATA
jgi:hypothetical protein